MEIAAFFERYRALLEAGDAAAVAALYRTPLPVIRPDRTVLVEQADTLRDEIAKILDFWRWSGMARIEMPRLSIERSEAGLDLASLTWRPVTVEGAAIARIDQTFVLRRTLLDLRIAAVIAHNEERGRVPILREALSAIDLAPPGPAGVAETG
jgi:hypothetical protein